MTKDPKQSKQLPLDLSLWDEYEDEIAKENRHLWDENKQDQEEFDKFNEDYNKKIEEDADKDYEQALEKYNKLSWHERLFVERPKRLNTAWLLVWPEILPLPKFLEPTIEGYIRFYLKAKK